MTSIRLKRDGEDSTESKHSDSKLPRKASKDML